MNIAYRIRKNDWGFHFCASFRKNTFLIEVKFCQTSQLLNYSVKLVNSITQNLNRKFSHDHDHNLFLMFHFKKLNLA